MKREQFLRAIIKRRNKQSSKRETLSADELAAIERIHQAFERIRQQRRDLCEGENDIERNYLELFQATGVDVLTLQNMDAAELDRWAQAAIRQRKADRDPWIIVAVADCSLNRSTINRHADDPGKPYIEQTDERGKYRIRKSRLTEYVDPAELDKYQV